MFDSIPERQSAQGDDIRRLIDLYDGLLARTVGEPLPEAASSELKATAAIYDLDTARPDTEVWSDLRGVLIRQVPATAGEIQAAAMADPLTLMVVEDDPETAADLTAALSEAGHRVIGPFHDADAAEAAAALQTIDLALLDINLSGETNGVALAKALKDSWGVRVLFLSGDVSAAARHAVEAEAVVLKPYSMREVLDAIARTATR